MHQTLFLMPKFYMNYPVSESASILCIGMGWFPHTPGGLNRYVYELLGQLAAQQDCIELWGVGLPDSPLDLPLQLINLASPSSALPKRLWAFHRQLSCRQAALPDAINLHFALYGFPLLKDLPENIPITCHFHGPWAGESQQEGDSQWQVLLKYWIEQQVYRRCDRFIVLSKAFGRILHEQYQVPWEKIHIIPGGVNIDRFRPNLSREEARLQLGWPLDRQILFTPRRLVQRMGLDKLLIAMAEVKRKVPEVWLAIAGKGPLRPTLEQQVEALNLSQCVQFLGYVPDEQLPIAYQAADLTVVPSQSLEGFGLILVESLACGTPALCTPVGGMPEIVAPFYPDLITDSVKIDAIADRLIQLLTGTLPLPSRMNCRNYAQQHFDWQLIAPKVRNVLLS
jgi:glycosyltransferase involved in cell wall biosynthesis